MKALHPLCRPMTATRSPVHNCFQSCQAAVCKRRRLAGSFQLSPSGPARSLRRKGPAQHWAPSILGPWERRLAHRVRLKSLCLDFYSL